MERKWAAEVYDLATSVAWFTSNRIILGRVGKEGKGSDSKLRGSAVAVPSGGLGIYNNTGVRKTHIEIVTYLESSDKSKTTKQ